MTSNRQLKDTDPTTANEKFAEAEKLLLESYQDLNARKDQIPAQWQKRITEANKRLIEHYEFMKKPDEVSKWRAELELSAGSK